MIELKNLSKNYSEKEAVVDLSLKIHDGQITAFLGPNGAGKTTTLKMMVGLLKPTSGQVLIDGVDFQNDPLRFKKILSYVPDFPFLFERLTGREFLSFVGGIYQMPSPLLKIRMEEMMDVFHLHEVRDQLIQQYSHGMKQRLAFCSALMRDPKIFIVDEPMVGLDPKTSRIFKDVLLKLAKTGAAVFISTHQLTVAEELCDKIAIIHKGKILREGHPKELIRSEEGFKNLEHYFLSVTEE